MHMVDTDQTTELWRASDKNQSGYEPLNGSSVNSSNFDATDLRFSSVSLS